jgi:hypothetical protein
MKIEKRKRTGLSWALGIVVLAVGAQPVRAEAPSLQVVDTAASPLKLSAPEGWQVHIQKPKHKDLATIASLNSPCAGIDISVTIQLDQNIKTPDKLLQDQYPNVKPTALRGSSCVVREANTEAMCVRKLSGLGGVVSVYFATTDAGAFAALGGGELAAAVAAGLGWKGGSVAKLAEWERPGIARSKDACPKAK